MTVKKDKESLLHYNYFLALEEDLEKVSRFIEFDKANLSTYSIEFAHLLLASSSEVDVILKQLCKLLDESKKPRNIDDYRSIIKEALPFHILDDFIHETVYIPRYNLNFIPWEKWEGDNNPYWWQSYNAVKHERNLHFSKANLQNVLNSLGGLLIVVVFYNWIKNRKENILKMGEIDAQNTKRETIWKLKPGSNFIQLEEKYYPINIVA